MKYLLIALLLFSCKKEIHEQPKTCYRCKLIIEGKYIANIDTCSTQAITAPQLICTAKP